MYTGTDNGISEDYGYKITTLVATICTLALVALGLYSYKWKKSQCSSQSEKCTKNPKTDSSAIEMSMDRG